MATGTFDGVEFEVYSTPMRKSADSLMHDHKIAGGDVTYRDLGGLLPRRWTYRVYTSSQAGWLALEAKRNVRGTLTTTKDGSVTATLKSLDRDDESWDGKTEGTAIFWEG